jgi:hypothetical protein
LSKCGSGAGRKSHSDTLCQVFEEVDFLMKGTVESYSEQKGFGFINQDDGEKAFFYRASINMSG